MISLDKLSLEEIIAGFVSLDEFLYYVLKQNIFFVFKWTTNYTFSENENEVKEILSQKRPGNV